jgi:hypothetical protein
MLILVAFTLVALATAGLLAITTNDSATYCIALVVLIVVVLLVAPQVPTLMAFLQHTIDTTAPVALH